MSETKKNDYGYISEYAEAIKNKDVIVGERIKQLYKIVIKNLDSGEYEYKPKKAKRAIAFIENFCRHHEGPLGGQLLKLELWQKAMIAMMFGIVDKDGYRQFREVLCVVGRKNGKTALMSAVATYAAYADGEYGARIYMAATKKAQAELCYNATYQTIRKEPELANLATKRRSDIYIKSTNSSIQYLAFAANRSDGLNPSFCICDEVSSWSGQKGILQYEVLKSALGARRQPMLCSITTAGYEDDGIYDQLLKRATAFLSGESDERRLLPILYMVDDAAKWDKIDELRKANPNLGVSISEAYLEEEIRIAKASYSKKTEFLCKYANVKQNASVAWLSKETINKAFCDEKIDLTKYSNSYAVVGIDLSKTTDLTSACYIIEKDGKLNVHSHFWLPTDRLKDAIKEDNLPYNKYIEQGWLSLSGTTEIQYSDVTEWITNIFKQYKIVPLICGYDNWSSTYLVQELKQKGIRCESIMQGPKLDSSITEVESRIKDGTINCYNNTLLKLHLLNTAVKTNSDEKRQIVKIAKRSHIDGTAALLCAIAVRRYYPDLKQRLANENRK